MMKYTNIHDIPEILVNAMSVKKQKYADITITELLKSPRQLQLARRHDDEIKMDISENFWAWYGSSLHFVLEASAKKFDALPEEKMYAEVGGWKVGGKPDLLLNENGQLKLVDLKTMSVFGYLLEKKQPKQPHIEQLNLYAHLFRLHGFRPDYMEVWALFKDWRRGEQKKDPDYPPIPFVRIKVPIWEDKQAKAFLEERVKIHQEAVTLSDDDLTLCTPDERWRRPSTWAVMEGTKNRATRVFNDPQDAKLFASDNAKYHVVERPGQDTKCLDYCAAATFCSYWQSLQNKNDPELINA